MFTVLFIILKFTQVIHVNWWWVLLAMLLDSGSIRYINANKEEEDEEEDEDENEEENEKRWEV